MFISRARTWSGDYIEVIFSTHRDCTHNGHNKLFHYHTIEVAAVEWRRDMLQICT